MKFDLIVEEVEERNLISVNNKRKSKQVDEAQLEGRRRWGKLRKEREQEQYIREIARKRGMELKTL